MARGPLRVSPHAKSGCLLALNPRGVSFVTSGLQFGLNYVRQRVPSRDSAQ